MAEIGAIEINLITKTAQFVEGMYKAQQSTESSMERISRSVEGASRLVKAGLAVIGVEATLSFAKGLIESAARMEDLSRETGVGIEQLQKLQFAANRAGVQQDAFTSLIDRFNKSVGDTVTVGGESAKAFDVLGVSLRDKVTGAVKDTSTAFLETIDALSKVENRSIRTSNAVAIFGREGSKIAGMAEGGAAALQKMTEEAERMGAVLGGDAATKANEMNTRLHEMDQVVRANLTSALVSLAPIIERVTEKIADLARRAGQWVNNSPTRDVERLQKELEDSLRGREVLQRRVEEDMRKAESSSSPLVSGFFKALAPDKQLEDMDAHIAQVRARLAEAQQLSAQGAFHADLAADAAEKGIGLGSKSGPVIGIGNRFAGGDRRIADMEREIAKTEQLSAALGRTNDVRSAEANWIRLESELKATGVQLSDAQIAKLHELSDKLTEVNKQYELQQNTIAELGSFGERAFSNIGDAVTQMAVESGRSFVTLRQLAAGVVSEIYQEFLKLALLNPLKNLIFGGNAATLQSVGGWLGNLINASGSGPSITPEDYGPMIPAAAMGGPIDGPTLVGEKGPEIFDPGTSGRIIPNHELGRSGPQVFIDARNADREGLARLERLVMDLNGSIEQRAVGAVADMRHRDPAFLR